MINQTEPCLVEHARTLCRGQGASLLFLTLFGSTLYGTESPGKSDRDARGIFLPSPESLALNKAPHSLRFSTSSGSQRNKADDVDMDLWSVQHWLLKLLPAGDTGAMDLLFSPSHAACTLYRHPALDTVFADPLRFLDAGRGRAYAEYSLGQAKKYGIKGSRIGALKEVRNWLREHCLESSGPERLGDCLDALAKACTHSRHCSMEELRGEKMLRLCGKLHGSAVRMPEFIRRVEADMRRYGARAEDAERNEGLDFKALSHALRSLDQMEELLRTGNIIFPLKSRAELLAVKEGKYPWSELEPRILQRLAAVDALREKTPFTGTCDPGFAEECVLACYGLANPA